jgi:hypothetical protein
MFYGDAAAGVSALVDRPNFFKSRAAKHCKTFTQLKLRVLMSV